MRNGLISLISSKIAVLACIYTLSFAFTLGGGVTLQLSTFNPWSLPVFHIQPILAFCVLLLVDLRDLLWLHVASDPC